MIKITKGKILKENTVVEIEFTKRESSESKPAECTETHKDIPAKSLIDSFAALAIHAACITEFPGTETDNDKFIEDYSPDLVKNFHVSSFSINNIDDEKESVVITAQRKLTSGKVFGFSTPPIRFDDESENAYAFTDDLRKKINVCQDELVKYLNGKFGENPQQQLPFNEPVTQLQIAPVEETAEEEFDVEKLEKPSVAATKKKNKKTAEV